MRSDVDHRPRDLSIDMDPFVHSLPTKPTRQSSSYLDIIVNSNNFVVLSEGKLVAGGGELDGVLCLKYLVEFLELSHVSFGSIGQGGMEPTVRFLVSGKTK